MIPKRFIDETDFIAGLVKIYEFRFSLVHKIAWNLSEFMNVIAFSNLN